MKWVVNKGSGNDDGDGGGFGGEAAESVVRLRGLPYDCSKDDIKKFFDGERHTLFRKCSLLISKVTRVNPFE